jgi:hypothetical protein
MAMWLCNWLIASLLRGDWKYHDSYAWTKDGGGQEIIYYQGTPVWLMNYYGFRVGVEDTDVMGDFLHTALRKRHPVLPVRGDTHEDVEKKLCYEIVFERDSISNFVGKERITRDGVVVYQCYVHGGLVK